MTDGCFSPTLPNGVNRDPNPKHVRWQHLPDPGLKRHGDGVKILLADDNAADIELFKAAFDALDHHHDELEIARDGEEALRRLREDVSAGTQPAIVLLDINMPKMDGFEALIAIRADPKLKAIPVIFLSGSSDPQDVRRAYELGANSYLCKSPYDFFDLVGDFERYWLNRARLPSDRD